METPTPLFKHGGARRGGGRPKGSKNRPKLVLLPDAPRIDGDAVNPVTVLEEIASNPLNPPTARVAAAKALLEWRKGPPAEAASKHELVWYTRGGAA